MHAHADILIRSVKQEADILDDLVNFGSAFNALRVLKLHVGLPEQAVGWLPLRFGIDSRR
jgi:hypothetical protein